MTSATGLMGKTRPSTKWVAASISACTMRIVSTTLKWSSKEIHVRANHFLIGRIGNCAKIDWYEPLKIVMLSRFTLLYLTNARRQRKKLVGHEDECNGESWFGCTYNFGEMGYMMRRRETRDFWEFPPWWSAEVAYFVDDRTER